MIVPATLLSDFGLIGLLIITFLSASILPFPSEPAIVVAAAIFTPAVVFLVSLVGYVAGGITNYYIGLKGFRSLLIKRSTKEEKKARRLFHKWGTPILLVAPWIPFIGDPLLIVAGVLKMDFRKFFVITLTAKSFKIVAFILLGQSLLPLTSTIL